VERAILYLAGLTCLGAAIWAPFDPDAAIAGLSPTASSLAIALPWAVIAVLFWCAAVSRT
jgi:hypothetical protein